MMPLFHDPAPQLIRVEDLAVSYGGHQVLSGVCADFAPGSMTSLIGPSGCGKTSFLTCINRLVDFVPNCRVTGKLYVDGSNVLARGTNLRALRTRVGMIFQKPSPFPLSIWRNIALPLAQKGIRARGEVAARVEQALLDSGLWEEVKGRLGAPALGLSGGQQQRLCIARAIALEPEILLMDEPCSSLDPISGHRVEELIASFRGRYTVIIVTHNLAQAQRLTDNTGVFWMRDGTGTLIELGKTTDVFSRPTQPETAAYVSGQYG